MYVPGPCPRTIRCDPEAVVLHIGHKVDVRRVVVQFNVKTFVNNVEEELHGHVLINADDIVGGTVSRPSFTQQQFEVEEDVYGGVPIMRRTPPE